MYILKINHYGGREPLIFVKGYIKVDNQNGEAYR